MSILSFSLSLVWAFEQRSHLPTFTMLFGGRHMDAFMGGALPPNSNAPNVLEM